MDVAILDIETDGLLPDVSLIHCMSVEERRGGQKRTFTLTSIEAMRTYLDSNPDLIIVGHNIIRYDIPVLELLAGYRKSHRFIDTLALSFYIYPTKKQHGLEEWGEIVKVPKPFISDWKNLQLSDYINRCKTDVKINSIIFDNFIAYLTELYGTLGIDKILRYLMFKFDCAREQDTQECRLNRPRLFEVKDILDKAKDEKCDELRMYMPEKVTYKERVRPKVMFKKDGTISALGEKWISKLAELGLDENTPSIQVEDKREPGNPGSHVQMKAWLVSLGWEATLFKYERNKETGENRAIPQISQEGKICENIIALYREHPYLSSLEGLTIIDHRLKVVNSMIECLGDGEIVYADVGGFTNTLRFKHRKPIVNLPKIHLPYGKEIRGSIIAHEGYTLCGSDMSSLEDSTKQHYMFFHDPEYVNEMREPGFDPHISIAVFADMMTQAQADFFKWFKKQPEVKDAPPPIEGLNYRPMSLEQLKELPYSNQKALYIFLNERRGDAKVVNFSSVYGVGAAKMSLKTGWPIKKSKSLIEAYWKKNWSVKTVASECYVKTVDNQMWLYNPVSRMYYSLRADKDRFSTLNQGKHLCPV